jgi:uncharacterized membrane protein (DUF485 family)
MHGHLFRTLEGLEIVITHLDMPVPATGAQPIVSPIQAFDDCIAAKNRMLLILGAAIFIYYFALIVGAGWFRPFYTRSLPGGLNIGIAFALSQYVFVAALALIYARRMKRVDAQIKRLAEAPEMKNETR